MKDGGDVCRCQKFHNPRISSLGRDTLRSLKALGREVARTLTVGNPDSPGMAQSAVVRDYRALEVGRRRANRLVLTVRGMKSLPQPNLSSRPKRMLPVLVRKAA